MEKHPPSPSTSKGEETKNRRWLGGLNFKSWGAGMGMLAKFLGEAVTFLYICIVALL